MNEIFIVSCNNNILTYTKTLEQKDPFVAYINKDTNYFLNGEQVTFNDVSKLFVYGYKANICVNGNILLSISINN